MAVPAIALTVAAPLTLSACVWALWEDGEETDEGPVPVVGAQRA